MRRIIKALLGSAALCAAFLAGHVVALMPDEVIVITSAASQACQALGGCVMIPQKALGAANRRLEECELIDTKGRT